MKRLNILFLVAAAFAVFNVPAGFADSNERRGVKAGITGDITEITKTDVTIKPRTRDAEKIPANEIVRIRWEGEPIKLNSGRGQEERGYLANALTNYQDSLGDVKADNANLKTEVEYLIARTTARMALADSTKVDEASKRLQDFQKAHSNNFRYFESLAFLGRVQMAKNDYAGAKTTFELLTQAPWGDYKMSAQIGTARVLLEQQQYDQALQAFEAVIGMPGNSPAETARKQEALLGKATCLQKQQKHNEAITALNEVIQKVSPDETAIQAEAYVRQGDSLQVVGKLKEAVLAYLHVDLLFQAETDLHAESLYQLWKLSPQIGQPERGGEALARLQADYPNNEWTKKSAGETN